MEGSGGVGEHDQLAVRRDPEVGGDAGDAGTEAHHLVVGTDGEQRTGEVGEHVGAVEGGRLGPVVHAAADDGGADLVVAVRPHRRHRVRRRALVVHLGALDEVPAEVEAGRAVGDAIDLLHRVVAHVAGPQVPGGGSTAEAPRVAQPLGPDLRGLALLAHERVVGRDVVAGAVGVGDDADHPAEQLGVVLGVASVAAAAVTEGEEQRAVGRERQPATLVAEPGLVDEQHLPRRGRIGPARGVDRVGHEV